MKNTLRIVGSLAALLVAVSAHAERDDFNRTEAGSNWTAIAGSGLAVNAKQARCKGSCASVWAGSQVGADQYVQVKLAALGAGTVDVMARATGSNATLSCYTLRLDLKENTWSVIKVQGGAESVIMAASGTTFAANDAWRIEAAGDNVVVYRNGTNVGRVTDSAVRSGQPALGMNGDKIRVADFVAGNLPPHVRLPAPSSLPHRGA